MQWLWIVMGILGGISLIVWIGLRIKSPQLPAYAGIVPNQLELITIPAGLPAPVERYYQAVAVNGKLPVVYSAVFTGHGKLRFMGIAFPGRARFTHEAGYGYRHYLDISFWGLPMMKVNERFLDDEARLELPFGVVEGEPKINQAACLGLWAESFVFPSLFLTDTRVHWEEVDDSTAELYVPCPDGEEKFTVKFDPETDLMTYAEVMRYRDAVDEAKIPWRIGGLGWREMSGVLVPSPMTAEWDDEGSPWLVLELEELALNPDVEMYIRASGP